MGAELLIRFIVGGLVVSAFAVIGEIVKPKSFAGIFGAAPSVALATLGLTFMTHGGSYAGLEGRSMVVGAVALCVYSLAIGWLITRRKLRALAATSSVCLLWVAVALGAWSVVLR